MKISNPDSQLVHVGGKKQRLSAKTVNTLDRRLRTVLAREVDQLMAASYGKKLNEKDARTLIAYIRTVNELKQLEKIEKAEKPKDEKA